MVYLLKLLKSNPDSSIPSVSLAQIGSNSSAFSCHSSLTPWIIDSGASDHMANLSHVFHSYSPCSSHKKVRIVDGNLSSIAGKVLMGDDHVELKSIKIVLADDFEIKDLGVLKHFLRIKFARSKKGIIMSQQKYVLDLLEETGLLGCKATETPIEPNLTL
ncbi:uncharacterized protein LOC114299661 [Camellia sinensis]|uniref:uncharacterized protein LOC114299661 n=1 Tax=Camellia sinensis TaxID=4442 RepID=UPI00103602ED|nr:uncharacterized protein LOC114299661 [Camellia sinensis]